MDKLYLNLDTGITEIIFGNFFEKLNHLSNGRKVIVICDQKVNSLYPEISVNYSVININALESEKNLITVEKIYSSLLELKADRSTLLVAIGGGIICDITGFIASTFFRGLDLILIPTTLLAMVDASIGGKNGVNFKNNKNLIGIINQPEAIIVDDSFLKTLPLEEFKNGIAEIVKHSIISGGEFYKIISNNNDLKSGVINTNILKSAIQIKIDVVSADVNEKGLRRVLNLGHTLGHIIELKQEIGHGKAVAIGIMIAAKLSAHLKKCNIKVVEDIYNMLTFYELPVQSALSINEIIMHIDYDKKKDNESLHFVFINNIGKVISESISFEKLKTGLLEVFN